MSDHLVAFLFADNAGDRDSHLASSEGKVEWSKVFPKSLSAATLAPCATRDPAFRTGLPTTQMTEKPQSTNAIRVYKQPSPN